MSDRDVDVVVVGGGPTGLMLAGELALAGVDVVIVERRRDQELVGVRAGGLHAGSLEMFEMRGIADRFLAAGQIAQVAGYAWIRLDISDIPSRHPYGLALPQSEIERILATWVEELGVPVHRGREVVGLGQDEAGVTVELANGTTMRASYLVGCDGGRSLVRKAAGIAFPGWDATISNLIAEVRMTEEPAWGQRRDAHGIHGLGKMGDGMVRVMLTEPEVGRTDQPTLQDLRAALIAAYGADFGAHSPRSISRFTDMARQAETYRKGRVLLAGDAAHIHYPTGGQGLNIGVQDAFNLGWKLAQVVQGAAPETLLDSYHAERHPVAARVLQNTMAQVALLRTDERTDALRAAMGDLLAMDEPRKTFGAMMSGLDIRYPMGDGHPLLGRRMPDLDLVTANGPTRVSVLMYAARPVLLNVGEPGAFASYEERVRVVDARCDGPWELPVVGSIASPVGTLIRPDGYIAWVGSRPDVGLDEALATWCGYSQTA